MVTLTCVDANGNRGIISLPDSEWWDTIRDKYAADLDAAAKVSELDGLQAYREGYHYYMWHHAKVDDSMHPLVTSGREDATKTYNNAIRKLLEAAIGLYVTNQLDADKTADLMTSISMASYTDCIRYAGGLKSALSELERGGA